MEALSRTTPDRTQATTEVPRCLMAWLVRICLTLASGPVIAGSATVIDSMTKVRRNDPPVASGIHSISLEAAQGEFEAFQIVVRGPANAITARATSLSGPGAFQLPAADCNKTGNVRLYREVELQIGTTVANGAPVSPPPLSDPAGSADGCPTR